MLIVAARGVALAILAVAALVPAAVAVRAAPAVVTVPLDGYPQPRPQPVGASRPPAYLDDDETVKVRMTADGSPSEVRDDILLRMRGAGDYVIVTPGIATAVSDLGGDVPPALEDGHVSFLGSVFGPGQLNAEATLPPGAAKQLPLSVRVGYDVGGQAVDAAAIPSTRGPLGVEVEVGNLTAKSRQLTRGSADVPGLATTLEALRQAAATYTPETDMQAALPVPTSLTVAGPSPEAHQVLVPFSLTVTVRLPPGETASATGTANATVDARGTSLVWREYLPRRPDAPSEQAYRFTISGALKRVPSVEVRADPLPFPAPVFTAPGGVGWSAYLGGRSDRSPETLLAQEGMAAFNRVGELPMPLDRPGPGPQKVKYDFLLESGAARPSTAVPEPPPRAQPWAVALLVAGLSAGVAGAWWAWSRH